MTDVDDKGRRYATPGVAIEEMSPLGYFRVKSRSRLSLRFGKWLLRLRLPWTIERADYVDDWSDIAWGGTPLIFTNSTPSRSSPGSPPDEKPQQP